MSRNEAYGYAVARIRAMEPLLFDASGFQRMIDAPDLSGALKILSETNYASAFTEGGAESRYDSALESSLQSAFDELSTFVPDRELIDLFRVPYDFHNVKVILKGQFKSRSGGKQRYDLMTHLGSISVDDLASDIGSESYDLLPCRLSQIIPLCMSVWEQSGDIVEIEKLLDHGLFEAMLILAEKTRFTGVLEWVRARIDSENIRNLLRLKRFGFDSSEAATFLHEGGTVFPSVLTPLLSEQFDSWGRSLSYSGVGLVISSVQDGGNFDTLILSLEKALDDFCSAIVREARFSANAPENVIAFLWGKEMEVKNIRTILVSKGSNSDPEEVKGMMRRGYN